MTELTPAERAYRRADEIYVELVQALAGALTPSGPAATEQPLRAALHMLTDPEFGLMDVEDLEDAVYELSVLAPGLVVEKVHDLIAELNALIEVAAQEGLDET